MRQQTPSPGTRPPPLALFGHLISHPFPSSSQYSSSPRSLSCQLSSVFLLLSARHFHTHLTLKATCMQKKSEREFAENQKSLKKLYFRRPPITSHHALHHLCFNVLRKPIYMCNVRWNKASLRGCADVCQIRVCPSVSLTLFSLIPLLPWIFHVFFLSALIS